MEAGENQKRGLSRTATVSRMMVASWEWFLGLSSFSPGTFGSSPRKRNTELSVRFGDSAEAEFASENEKGQGAGGVGMQGCGSLLRLLKL